MRPRAAVVSRAVRKRAVESLYTGSASRDARGHESDRLHRVAQIVLCDMGYHSYEYLPATRADPTMSTDIDVRWLDSEWIYAREISEPHPLRKAAPYNELLPMTVRWAEQLPPSIKPEALLASFPRVANSLAANWHDAAALISCFEALLIDHRGDRLGFPTAVQQNIASLKAFYLWRDRVTGSSRRVQA